MNKWIKHDLNIFAGLTLCVFDFQPDHDQWCEIMTLRNESDERSSPSFPPSIIQQNLSLFATNDPSDWTPAFPMSSSLPTFSNCTSLAPDPPPRYNFYAMLLVLLIFCVVFGNVLVCLAVSRERALQTTTNYLIVSLAVSDLLLATLVMPWGVYLEVKTCHYIKKSIYKDHLITTFNTHKQTFGYFSSNLLFFFNYWT